MERLPERPHRVLRRHRRTAPGRAHKAVITFFNGRDIQAPIVTILDEEGGTLKQELKAVSGRQVQLEVDLRLVDDGYNDGKSIVLRRAQ